MIERDDLHARYMGAREQDNDALAEQDAIDEAIKSYEQRIANNMPKMYSEHFQKQQAESKPAVEPQGSQPEQTADNQDNGMGFEIPNADMQWTGDNAEGATIIDPEETTLRSFRDAMNDVIMSAPKNITMGVVKAIDNTVEAVAPGMLAKADSALSEVFPEYVAATNEFFNTHISKGEDGDRIVQDMASFMVPFAGYMKVLGATTKLGTISSGFAADAMASFFNVDPHMERLSEVAMQMGIENEFIGYMANQTGSETENRFRNVLEGQAMGATFLAAAQTLKGAWWTAKAMKAEYDRVGPDEFFRGKPEDRQRGSIKLKEADALPMDEESRMARAEKMGFNVDVYHGTSSDIESFNVMKRGLSTKSKSAKMATWLVDDATTAEGYANFSAVDAKVQSIIDASMTEERKGNYTKASKLMEEAEYLERRLAKEPENGQNIMQLKIKGENLMEVDAEGQTWGGLEDNQVVDWINEAKDKGFDGLKIKNFSDEAQWGRDNPATHYAIFDPKNIRSRHAAFDLTKKGSASLTAGVAGVAAMENDKSKKGEM